MDWQTILYNTVVPKHRRRRFIQSLERRFSCDTRWYEARRAEAAAAAARAARFAPLDVPPSPLAANFAHTGRVGHDTDSAGGLVFEPRRWAGNVPLPRVVRQVRG